MDGSMAPQEISSPPAEREHFHPLEIIPFFRRFPRSFGRDVLYTFIWSALFGIFFYMLGAFTAGKMPSFRDFGIYLLIANFVGYCIHFLFSAGHALDLDLLARRSGFLAKVAYFAAIPMAGVLMGLALASLVVDVGLRSMWKNPAALFSILSTSLVVSMVLSVIFFWRERSAVAAAALAGERERSERIEREAALANLRALQAQIEPHFLFNTLANVTSLVDADPKLAKRMLESFIRFLRASLAATRMERTTLGEEAMLIAAFLDVLQVRMGQRLRYRVDVAPDLSGHELPPMLLQPLVENAIRHGLEPKVDGGEIAVAMRREADQVVIEVADTGVGFAPTTRGGLGLTNVRDRLRLLYGERAALTIGENQPCGTRVALRLPA